MRVHRLEPAVGDAEHEFGFEHAFQIDAIDDAFDGGQDLIGEFDFPNTSARPRP